MKFKDLKVGQQFTRPEWKAVNEKIHVLNSGRLWTHKEVDPPTGIKQAWLKADDEVVLICSNCKSACEKTYGENNEWCENCVSF